MRHTPRPMPIDWAAAFRSAARSVAIGVGAVLVALAFWYAALAAMARLG